MRLGGRPACRVAGRGAREDVIERTSRGVPPGERLTQTPGLAQRGDQRGVPILLVVYRPWLHPWRHDDGRHPVPGTIEGETELAGRCGRVRRRDRPRRDMIV